MRRAAREILPVVVLGLLLGAVGCEPFGRATMLPGVDCIACHSAAASVIPGSCASNITSNGPFCNGSSLQWTAAGTVLSDIDADPDGGGVPDVHILLQDALGKRVNLTSNSVGNFFTAEPLAFNAAFADGGSAALVVQIEYQGQCLQMNTHPAPTTEYLASGVAGVGCNGCHVPGSMIGEGAFATNRVPYYPDGGPLGYLSVPQGPNLQSLFKGLIDVCDGGFWGHSIGSSLTPVAS